jgi:sulfhydrogenase subunit alpha
MTERRELAIEVPVLARVEGEGALELSIRDGRIEALRLNIYEPPRLFEKLLEGRSYEEVPDAVARICGICPVAYQMSAVRAIESAFAVEVTPWIAAMRRLFYCGEWIESHALHIHLLAAPDFFGLNSVLELAEKQPEAVRRGLALQALGNEIIRFLGARSVHPVGARPGGFHRAPTRGEASTLRDKLIAALPEAEALARWCGALPLPEDHQDFECVSVVEPGTYPMMGERIISSRGLDIAIAEFAEVFEERQVPHSTALHCLLRGEPYLVGPLARLNLHWSRLPEAVRKVAQATGVRWPSDNMYHSVVARAVEIHYALIEAIRLLEAYEETAAPWVPLTPREAEGCGATEAPRGLLWHQYRFDASGRVLRARIVPPTSQNQARIEADLVANLTAFGLEREEAALRQRAEQVIRNYDPCISCATHFLRLEVKRS